MSSLTRVLADIGIFRIVVSLGVLALLIYAFTPKGAGREPREQAPPRSRDSNTFRSKSTFDRQRMDPRSNSNPFGQRMPPRRDNSFGQRVSPRRDNSFGQRVPPRRDNSLGQRTSSRESNPFGQRTSSRDSNPFGQKKPPKSPWDKF